MKLKPYKSFFNVNEARIISSSEKTMDAKGKVIRPGDIVEHYRFGRGFIQAVDLKTYSIPFITVEIHTGKFKGEIIYRAANEFLLKHSLTKG